MEDTIQMIAFTVGTVVVVLGVVLGVTLAIWDNSNRYSEQEQILATTCITNGGSWLPIAGNDICLARNTPANVSR